MAKKGDRSEKPISKQLSGSLISLSPATSVARYNERMNPIAIENSQAEIFARAIDCHADDLTPDVTRFIMSLELAADDERRMNELGEHARQANLPLPKKLSWKNSVAAVG